MGKHRKPSLIGRIVETMIEANRRQYDALQVDLDRLAIEVREARLRRAVNA